MPRAGRANVMPTSPICVDKKSGSWVSLCRDNTLGSRGEALMLSRIAKLDRQFIEAIQSYVQTCSRGTPVLSDIRAHVIHEGKASSLRRSPTEIEPTAMKEASVETKSSFDEIDKVNIAYVLAKANEIAADFQRQFSSHLFKTIEEVTEQTGQKKDAGGAPLTNDTLIELFSMMQMNFEHSQSGDITIVTAPGMISTFQRLECEMNENPEIKFRWNRMMEAKRNEFREREINRNLVG